MKLKDEVQHFIYSLRERSYSAYTSLFWKDHNIFHRAIIDDRLDYQQNPSTCFITNTGTLNPIVRYHQNACKVHIKPSHFTGGRRGQHQEFQRRDLQQSLPHIVVVTPGRVDHMIQVQMLNVEHLSFIVLEEANEIIGAGFKDKIEDIYDILPRSAQTILLTSTMFFEELQLTDEILRNPIRIHVPREKLSLDGLQQFYIAVEKEEHKQDILMDPYETLQLGQTILFCNSKRKVNFLADLLQEKKFTMRSIHGSMEMHERNQMVKDFKVGRSRGIDVHQILIIMNFDLPTEKEQYIHRIGRAARFGRKAIAIKLVTEDDGAQLQEIISNKG
ncbi:MAG: putative ATP-dependent RNA helicase fal1 [Streblomastix strix]|uniref:Putative ATP-dependent RNA helicase fal1 n=1 Tax=Streblomastix strix TaxID=222440 RepID=A0A5J4VRV6_9EUKA|nr:MAG: putative ATP-dependent RNA helicase fal1 [Streblomastix strix]